MKKILLTACSLLVLGKVANAQQIHGQTNLMIAAQYDDVKMMKKLLAQGLESVNAVDNNNNTAYCYAYYYQNYDASELLKEYGATMYRRCNMKGVTFVTNDVTMPNAYSYGSSKAGFMPRFRLPTPSFGTVLAGIGTAGVIAAAAGGGGGGSSAPAYTFTKPATSNDVDPTSFETAEFYGYSAGSGHSQFLDIINAQYAYARGYTGTGQQIAILDSGILATHDEFSGTLTGDLTGTDLDEGDNDPSHGVLQSDHGTNVAAVAAGTKNNSGAGVIGMHGVAYNATIVPYRVGNFIQEIDPTLVDDAITDGVSRGVEIYNMSFNTDADGSSNATMATKSDMEFYFTGTNDGNDNTNTVDMQNLINNVTTNDLIFVLATGNDGYSQPGLLSALPLEYSEFDGHFVSVGALNEAGNAVAGYSNRCGVTKDYCIMAPGSSLITAMGDGNDDDYILASGTSFATPVVSGAIALVKEAFGLSADRTLNIIFQTASDMGEPGVDDVYGHGLLNIDLATAPGAELLALNSGGAISYDNSRVISSNTVADIQIPDFVIEDELYRTFTITDDSIRTTADANLELSEREKSFAKEKVKKTTKVNNFLTSSFISADVGTNNLIDGVESFSFTANQLNTDYTFGFTHNPGLNDEEIELSSSLLKQSATSHPYLALAGEGFVAKTSYDINDNLSFATNVFLGDIEHEGTNLGKASSFLTSLNYSKDKTQYGFEVGFVNEKQTLLGSQFTGALAIGESNYTYFTGINAKSEITDKLNIFANAYIGLTKVNTVNNSLITNIDNVVSHFASSGLEYKLAEDKKAGFVIAQPLKVSSGNVNFDVLSGGNIDKGYEYSNYTQSLAPSATQFDLQAFYKQSIAKNTKLHFGALHSINAGSLKGEKDSSVLVKLRHKF